MSTLRCVIPEWPAPSRVRACVTTRVGGCSQQPWDSLNLATHVGDRAPDVHENRRRLRETVALPGEPVWLQQIHGTTLVEARPGPIMEADASFTHSPGVVCAILTADCLPILLCDREASIVVAIHAGWRGLANGILGRCLAILGSHDWIAWIGPGISRESYAVGPEVVEAFTAQNSVLGAFFPAVGDRHAADLHGVAEYQLRAAGVRHVSRYEGCTALESDTFFSYRRDGKTGRFASLIWLE